MRQQGQHIIVSGAGTGIGRAVALRLASEGADLTLLARDDSRLRGVCDEIRSMGGRSQAFPCDIRVREEVDSSIAKAVEAMGPLRAFIANSGIGGANSDGADDRFDDLLQTNLAGTYYCLRAAERNLASKGTRHMVIVSSCLARFGVPGYTGYCASKAGLLGLNRALAMELEPHSTSRSTRSVRAGWIPRWPVLASRGWLRRWESPLRRLCLRR